MFAARLRGLPSVGIDSSKVAAAISTAKHVFVQPEDIISLCNSIIDGIDIADVPEGAFWETCYDHETLVQIVKIRSALLEHCETGAEIALRALMLGVLHGPRRVRTASYLSNQMPRTYSTKPDYSVRYWKSRDLRPPQVSVRELVERRAKFVFSHIPNKVPGSVMLRDSRHPIDHRPDGGFSWVITSPPYLGMVTYKQDQWLRDWFMGGSDRVDYTKGGQISRVSVNEFVNDLAKVWRNVSRVCASNARLVVRLGMLPSYKGSAREIVQDSIERSESGWVIKAIQPAGVPSDGRRQAEHFGQEIGHFNQEIDCFAELR